MALPLLIFDFDGTIADSVGHIVATMQGACRAQDAPVPGPMLVKSAMGLSTDDTARHCLPGMADDLVFRVARQYEIDWRASLKNHVTHLFPGKIELLTRLAQANTLAIATGKTRPGLLAVLDGMPELAKLFASLHTPSDGPGKPHPAMIEAAIAQNGADRAHTMMIGDATFDMQMARSAGVYAVGVTWGTMDRETLFATGAHEVVDSVAELDAAIAAFLAQPKVA